MSDLIQDLRYATRSLARRRGFAALVILVLACGIGPATAMFSLVEAVLIRPLPFPDPGELVMLWEREPRHSVLKDPVADGAVIVYQHDVTAFRALGAFSRVFGLPVRLHGILQPLRDVYVSDGFFAALGVRPLLGRTLLPTDFGYPFHHVVMLSYAYWRREFGGDPRVIGKTLATGGAGAGKGYTVIGVMPRGFRFPWPVSHTRPDVWMPAYWSFIPPLGHNSYVIARLKRGVLPSEALPEVATVAKRLAVQYPSLRKGVGAFLLPLRTQMAESVRRPLLLLFAAAAFVILIACANAAALMLANAGDRRREVAVHAAVGASPRRLLRQRIAELSVMGLAAGAAGLLIARAGLLLSIHWAPIGLFAPGLAEAGIDYRVLAFAVLASWLASIASGLTPTLSLVRTNLSKTLRESGGGPTGRYGRARRVSVLVPLEIAMAVALMAGAGLMLRSIQKLEHASLGFDPRRLLTARLTCPDLGIIDCEEEFLRRAARLPGVRRAALIDFFPLSGEPSDFNFGRQRPLTYSSWPYTAGFHAITPGYFKVVGDQLLRGRLFAASDDRTRAPKVVIINEAMAGRYWPGRDPIGEQITVTPAHVLPPPAYTIVGIVRDFQRFGLHSQPRPAIYVPFSQFGAGFPKCLLETAGDASVLAPTLRKLAESADRSVMLDQIATGDELFARSVAGPELVARVLDLFALLGLLLATLGTYGVVRRLTGQRTHEIGVRIALGAQPWDVTRMVVAEGMRWALIGVAVGLALAVALGRALRGLLYQVQPGDSLTLCAVALLTLGAALVACYLPARRAAKLDPVKTLRCE
jgi:predicted permease